METRKVWKDSQFLAMGKWHEKTLHEARSFGAGCRGWKTSRKEKFEMKIKERGLS